MALETGRDCPNHRNHTKCPEDYIAWHEWTEKKSKTHTQIRCEGCGRYEIWIPRKKSNATKDN